MVGDRKKFDLPLSAEELELFIDYLNDNSGNMLDPRLGNEFEFMERNGFDPALMHTWISSSINDFDSPLRVDTPEGYHNPDGRSDEYVRGVALQLRDHYRARWGLPPLTEAQKREWDTDPLPTKHYATLKKPKPEGWNGTLSYAQLTEEQIDAAVEYMRQNFSEIIRYRLAVLNEAGEQGYTGSNEVGLIGIFEGYVHEAIAAICTINYDEMISPACEFRIRDILTAKGEATNAQ